MAGEFPVTRREFDSLLARVKALEAWTGEAVARIKELQEIAVKAKEHFEKNPPAGGAEGKPEITMW